MTEILTMKISLDKESKAKARWGERGLGKENPLCIN